MSSTSDKPASENFREKYKFFGQKEFREEIMQDLNENYFEVSCFDKKINAKNIVSRFKNVLTSVVDVLNKGFARVQPTTAVPLTEVRYVHILKCYIVWSIIEDLLRNSKYFKFNTSIDMISTVRHCIGNSYNNLQEYKKLDIIKNTGIGNIHTFGIHEVVYVEFRVGLSHPPQSKAVVLVADLRMFLQKQDFVTNLEDVLNHIYVIDSDEIIEYERKQHETDSLKPLQEYCKMMYTDIDKCVYKKGFYMNETERREPFLLKKGVTYCVGDQPPTIPEQNCNSDSGIDQSSESENPDSNSESSSEIDQNDEQPQHTDTPSAALFEQMVPFLDMLSLPDVSYPQLLSGLMSAINNMSLIIVRDGIPRYQFGQVYKMTITLMDIMNTVDRNNPDNSKLKIQIQTAVWSVVGSFA